MVGPDFLLGENTGMIRATSARFASDKIAPLATKIDAENWLPRASFNCKATAPFYNLANGIANFSIRTAKPMCGSGSPASGATDLTEINFHSLF